MARAEKKIENSTMFWHKNSSVARNLYNLAGVPIDMFGIKAEGSPFWPSAATTGLTPRLTGALKGFNVLDATPKQIADQERWSSTTANLAPYLIGAQGLRFASSYLNARYDRSGQRLDSKSSYDQAYKAMGITSWHAVSITGDDQTKLDDVRDAFLQTNSDVVETWMNDFRTRADQLYVDRGPVAIDIVDQPSSGNLIVEGRIDGKEIFKVTKNRDLIFGDSDTLEERVASQVLNLSFQMWLASSLEKSAVVGSEMQKIVRDELRPAIALTDAWKQKFSLWTSPGTDTVADTFNYYGLADQSYLDVKNKVRQSENFLPPNAVLITPNPNDPAQEGAGAASIEEAP